MSASLSYSLVITAAPWASQAPQSALALAQAIIQGGHRIDRVFLYGDGVHLASSLATPPSDETHWPVEWSRFLAEHDIAGIVCIASALRRGIVNGTEQTRYHLEANNLRAPFEIAGLGEWVESRLQSDRVLYFHGGQS